MKSVLLTVSRKQRRTQEKIRPQGRASCDPPLHKAIILQIHQGINSLDSRELPRANHFSSLQPTQQYMNPWEIFHIQPRALVSKIQPS